MGLHILLAIIIISSPASRVNAQAGTQKTGRGANYSNEITFKTAIIDNYAPYTFVNAQGQPDGFSVDLMQAVALVMGINLAVPERLSQGMSIIKATGQYDQIFKIWFGTLESHGIEPKIFLQLLGGIILVFSLLGSMLVFWSFALKNQVAARTQSLELEIQERLQAEQIARKEHDKLEATLGALPDLLFEVGLDGFVYDFHSPRTEFLYRPAEDTIGKKVQDILPANIAEVVLSAIQDAHEKGYSTGKQFELSVPTRSGSSIKGILWFEISVSCKVSDPDQAHFIVLSRDITERKQAEELIRQYTKTLERRLEERTADLSRVNSDLARALRARSEFLASMSHELRTPLTGILGLSEALQLNAFGELNDRQQKTLATIEDSGRHLLDLINDILDLSKIEAGKLELQFDIFSIADVCQASLQMTKSKALQKKQNVHYLAPAEPVMVRADARRLKQILVNLLGNAIKFTPQDGELGLEIQTNESEQTLKLIVWDKGIGIEAEELHKLFKPFVQIDSSFARQYSGTGLGLSLAQRLTEMHNGGIEIESVFGQGSRFIVTLPWSSLVTGDDLLSNSQEQGTRSSRMELPLRVMELPLRVVELPLRVVELPLRVVMFADDNEMVLHVVADFLETGQFRVVKIRGGAELLERITEVHPDIILVDIQMPGMGGLETIRRIRAHADPLIAAIPVIAVTALAIPGDRELCLLAGANEYLSKPLKLKKLAATIQKLIEQPLRVIEEKL